MQHLEIRSAFSGQIPIKVMISARSQKYRKLVGP